MWYLVRRDAQSAADAMAIAGALAAAEALAAQPPTDPMAAALSAVTSPAIANGFTDGASSLVGTVTVTPTYLAGGYTYTSNTGTNTELNEVQVTVSEVVNPLISRIFTNSNIGPTVGAQAAAVVEPIGNACALSLTGDLSIQGTISSDSCGLASNAGDSTAINVTGSLTALTITAVGGIAGSDIRLATPSAPYHPPTVDPYASTAGAVDFTPYLPGCILPPVPVTGTATPFAPNALGYKAYCGGEIIMNDPTEALQFDPGGTYIFNNVQLILSAGEIQCGLCSVNGSNGISIVLLGTSTLTIGSSVSVTANMNAAKTNTAFPNLSGILFYGTGSGAANISLQTTSSATQIEGAVYFPQAALTFTIFSHNPANCLSLVAGTLTLYGTFSLSPACTSVGTNLAQMLGVRLVQ
jgi:hypothetical protein